MKIIHNTADTSIHSYKDARQSGQIARDKATVMTAVDKHQLLTSRMLAEILKVERTNITRSLNDLENKNNLIKKALKDVWQTTGKTVYDYTLIAWEVVN